MAETGTRTVAFLFCDTVGSTELLTRLGVEASEELRRRLWAVLREAVAATLGEEVKSLGDGLMIAFPVSSGDAVACAIAMHRGVVRLNLEQRISALSVRIGLSVGEATLESEERDWFGGIALDSLNPRVNQSGGRAIAPWVGLCRGCVQPRCSAALVV